MSVVLVNPCLFIEAKTTLLPPFSLPGLFWLSSNSLFILPAAQSVCTSSSVLLNQDTNSPPQDISLTP